MKQTSAWAPGNISLIFKVIDRPDPRWKGSLGVGFTLNEGVTATVQRAEKFSITFNDKPTNIEPVELVWKKLIQKPIAISLESKLQLGCGFGVSGASTLATAYALNELFELGKNTLDLAILAHTAEVESGTGLGDIANQWHGGCILKLVPSSQFTVTQLRIAEPQVFTKVFSGLLTKSIITDQDRLARINTAADTELNAIHGLYKTNTLTFDKLLDRSFQFALASGLLRERETVKMISELRKQGHHATMIMLGNAVVSNKYFNGAQTYQISNTAAHVIRE